MDPDSPQARMARLIMSSPVGQNAVRRVAPTATGSGSGGGTATPRGVSTDRIVDELGAELNDLWNASNPHVTNIPSASKRLPMSSPTTTKVEQGCWILYNRVDGSLRTARFTMPSTRDSCDPGAPPLWTNERVAAFFHTHPNTGDEGYDKGPSQADISYANSNNYPGLVRSQIGGYTWFGPNVT